MKDKRRLCLKRPSSLGHPEGADPVRTSISSAAGRMNQPTPYPFQPT